MSQVNKGIWERRDRRCSGDEIIVFKLKVKFSLNKSNNQAKTKTTTKVKQRKLRFLGVKMNTLGTGVGFNHNNK